MESNKRQRTLSRMVIRAPDAFMDLDIAADDFEDENMETTSEANQPTNSPKKRRGSLNLLNKPNFLGSAKPGRQKITKILPISSLLILFS